MDIGGVLTAPIGVNLNQDNDDISHKNHDMSENWMKWIEDRYRNKLNTLSGLAESKEILTTGEQFLLSIGLSDIANTTAIMSSLSSAFTKCINDLKGTNG